MAQERASAMADAIIDVVAAPRESDHRPGHAADRVEGPPGDKERWVLFAMVAVRQSIERVG